VSLSWQEFNTIGYTGKTSQGEKISFEKYLNSLNKGVFKIECTKRDNGDFTEKYLVIRVEI